MEEDVKEMVSKFTFPFSKTLPTMQSWFKSFILSKWLFVLDDKSVSIVKNSHSAFSKFIETLYDNDANYWLGKFTHYQPIRKPELPIY